MKSVSINWPLWREGGMKVDQQTEILLRKNFGFKLFETEIGIDTFELSLLQSESQLIVLQGDKIKINNAIKGNQEKDVKEITVKATNTIEILEADEKDILNKLQGDLKQIIAEILKLQIKDIDIDEDMSGFGFDSISFTELSNKLNDQFNIQVIPALFYEHPSLLSLLKFLYKEYSEILSCHYIDTVRTVNIKPIINDGDGIPVLEQIKARTRFKPLNNKAQTTSYEPIAIVGMSGVMPQSETLEEFWKHLKDGEDLITEIPKDRWDWEKIYGDANSEENKTKIKWGGFMKEVDKFDPLFFGISPREAELMDPQQRIFLETAWKTIEDAGYKSKDIAGTNMGVFVGVASSDYSKLLKEYNVAIQAQTASGSDHAILANRISYLLNIHGPSEPIDTACSSSLTAVHRAVEAIQHGYCDMAIAGAVNLLVSPENYIATNKAGMLSEEGRCKTFDKSANGYARGEGSGALLLKPLSHAIKEGNHIYGLIKGIEINHGGHVSSLTTPNPNAQAEVIFKAWKKAGIDPSTIDYIEAHGTGTSLGDPIEINGLKKAFEQLYIEWGKKPSEIKHCGIGSVKTNIGHLETAAGIAGMIKVLLSIKNNQIPASIHLNEVNPYIQLDNSPLYIVKQTQDWKSKSDLPRRAGISSFGFGGTNAHVVIEEYMEPQKSLVNNQEPQIIVLSAKNKDRLKEYVKALVKHIETNNTNLSDVAYTLQIGRDPMPERLAVVASDIKVLLGKLNCYLEGKADIEDLHEKMPTQNKQKSFDFIEGEEGIGEVDWELLHDKSNQRRISLPTYPFARESYWVPERNTSLGGYNKQESISVLHPMIDRNTSTLEEQKFVTVFSGKEFFLSDHVIAGNKILPELAYIEMARAASELSGIENLRKIKDIVWAKPIIINDSCEVQVNLYPEEGSIDYEISTINNNCSRLVHGQGRLIIGSENLTNGYEHNIDLQSIKERCTKYISKEQFYKRYSETGCEYGKSLKSIKELYVGEGEVLAQLIFPEGVNTQLQDIRLHPSLMEGVLQTVTTATYLPYALGEIEIINEFKEICYAYSTLVSENVNIKKYNIDVVDEEGMFIVRIKDFTLEAVKTIDQTDDEVQSETLYFTSKWKPCSLIEHEKETIAGNILVFDQEKSCLNVLEDSIQIGINTVTYVRCGTNYTEVGESEYEIDPSNYKDYVKLLHSLKEKNRIPAVILHLWSKKELSTDQEHLKEELMSSVYSVYHLSRSLLKEKIENPIQIIYGYFINENFGKPHFEAVSGLLKTACLESSKIDYKSIGYDNKNSLELQSIIISELKSKDKDIVYQEGERIVKSLEEIAEIENSVKENKTLLKDKGVYLITGGAGGLGQIFAKHLAKEYQARLVLVGRSKLTKDKQSQIDLLKKYGAAVIYIQADISKKEEVDQLITKAKEEYKEINGIIHSAGVIRDSYLINKIEEEMTAVLNPKVYGTMWLDEATKKEPLDSGRAYQLIGLCGEMEV
ncbi:MAG: hypothetical protein CVU84_08520 [Firmicutes bacterium HGW-Firmicutes-1]|nr:MAG: hypothetical protein CVU84_08520 [Firmicutes bacterium HGW-Firmicutes-1]